MIGLMLNGLYLITLFAATPWMAYRAVRTGRYREGWGSKLFGLVPFLRKKNTIWFHAVSVGEVQVLRPMLADMRRRYPECTFCVSCTTKTGIELARKLFPDDVHFYFPMDFTWAVRRALRRIQPKLIVLVELELWPNFVKQAKRQNVPIAVINGRLSERSFRGYGHIGWLMKTTLQQVDWIGVQDATYASRFLALGARRDRVSITGSLKFDGAESNRHHEEVQSRRFLLGLDEHHSIFVVGSTQAPEEQIALSAFQKLSERFPNLRMIVVPRHPERFDDVYQLLAASHLKVLRRSQIGIQADAEDWQILLGDTVGELRWLWGLADYGFVGGSFGNRGGQNMIEPAAYGAAVSFGPNTKNFRDIVRLLLDANAATVLDEPEQLATWLESMLSNPKLATTLGERAFHVAMAHRGATARTIEHLAPFLPASTARRSKAA